MNKAIELNPKFAGAHSNLACYSAMSAVGTGEIAEGERVRLRKQALNSLRIALSLYTDQIDNDILVDREFGIRNNIQALGSWYQDKDLFSIRDSSSLAKLSSDERKAFQQLWGDVGMVAIRGQAALGVVPPPRPPVDAAGRQQTQLMMANALLRSGRAHLDNKDATAALPELMQAVSMARTFVSPEQLKEYSETLERCQAVLAEQAK